MCINYQYIVAHVLDLAYMYVSLVKLRTTPRSPPKYQHYLNAHVIKVISLDPNRVREKYSYFLSLTLNLHR